MTAADATPGHDGAPLVDGRAAEATPAADEGALPSAREIRALPLDQVRAIRRNAQRDEDDLSYLRRLLQGRIDILRAELLRRAGGEGLDVVDDPTGGLVERLSQILSDTPAGGRAARHVSLRPPREGRYREVAERLLGDVALSDLPACSDTELRAGMARLVRYEQQVSARRQQLQRTTDDCGAEMARRYREGEARVDDLLTGR